MTHNEIIRNFFIYAAAINKIAGEDKENLLLQELSSDVQSTLLTNPQYLSYTGPLFKNNILFANKEGEVLPTISKGWGTINQRVQTKVVNKMQPKPVDKMTDKELLDNFVDTSITICDRMPRSKSLQKQATTNYSALYDAVTCVASTLNSNVSVEEVAVEA